MDANTGSEYDIIEEWEETPYIESSDYFAE